MVPQFVSHGIPTVDTLDINCGIWIPATRIRIMFGITHHGVCEHVVRQVAEVGDAVTDYRKVNYKTDYEIWNENSKLHNQFYS